MKGYYELTGGGGAALIGTDFLLLMFEVICSFVYSSLFLPLILCSGLFCVSSLPFDYYIIWHTD